MCRRGLLLILVLGGTAPVARAQAPRGGVAVARAKLARAESLLAVVARRDSASRQSLYAARRAVIYEAGAVTAVLPDAVGRETGRLVVSGARRYLDGVVPEQFLSARVAVAYAATGVDSVLRARNLDARARVMADVTPRPDSLSDGWAVAAALARAYAETLDSTWRAWLPPALAVGWTLRRDGPAAVRELMRTDTRSGADCLAGGAGACRLWLGLDADANPYTARYRPEELRRMIVGRWFAVNGAMDLAHQCTTGSDDACVRLASLGLLPPVPAGASPLSSLLVFVRAHGPAGALARALQDTRGSVGDRLGRATGTSPDSLVAGWRIWLLTGGGQPRVTAGWRDVLPVLVFGALLLLAAVRSGRWR